MGEKKRQGEDFSEDEYEARTFCVTEKIGAMFLWAGIDCALFYILNDVDFSADNAEASPFSRSEKKVGNTRFIYPHCKEEGGLNSRFSIYYEAFQVMAISTFSNSCIL